MKKTMKIEKKKQSKLQLNPVNESTDKPIDIIGYLLEGDELVVANPCRISLQNLKENIKKHEKLSHKNKHLATIVVGVQVPFKMIKHEIHKKRQQINKN